MCFIDFFEGDFCGKPNQYIKFLKELKLLKTERAKIPETVLVSLGINTLGRPE